MCPVQLRLLALTPRCLKNHLAQADQPTVLMRAFWLDLEERERFIMLNRHWWQLESAGALALVQMKPQSITTNACQFTQLSRATRATQRARRNTQIGYYAASYPLKQALPSNASRNPTAGSLTFAFVFDVNVKRLMLQINTSSDKSETWCGLQLL